jgi:hypothetical protein
VRNNYSQFEEKIPDCFNVHVIVHRDIPGSVPKNVEFDGIGIVMTASVV